MSDDLELKAMRRMVALKKAPDDLLIFSKLMSPDPGDIDDVLRSRYEETPVARLLCQIIQKVARGEKKRIGVSIAPQHGKSDVLSRNGPAWIQGRNPYANQFLGTYNQPFADEFGDAVREKIQSSTFAQVFPDCKLRKGQKDLLITNKGGRMAFVGRGGSGTGKPADFLWVDDPLKDNIEAQSDSTRQEVWDWFNKVATSRIHSGSAIVIVHTRWHTDDLIGRLMDPDHPERNKAYKGIAEKWEYFNLPAVVDDPKLAKALGLTLEIPKNPDVVSMFGAKPMSALWPGRKDLPLLAEAKRMDSPGFNALYMGKPAPDDGDYFKAEWLVEYDEDDLPKNLEWYGASDHAVSTKTGKDYNVIGCAGIDEDDNIWVGHDIVWERLDAFRIVEELLTQMKNKGPVYWWMEGELISKSFGPFLQKRMQEENIYIPLDEVTPAKDKRTMARAIQGRMAMKKVRFPRFAPWWQDARRQILKFDSDAHDDFVTWLSLIGLGLVKQHTPEARDSSAPRVPAKSGTIEWILRDTAQRTLQEKRRAANAGW